MGSDRCKFGASFSSGRNSRERQRRRIIASHARKAVVLIFVGILLGFSARPACGAQNREEKPEFLIARRQVLDPFFRHSVVLMLPMPKSPLVVGLIINKPTRVTLDKLFPTRPEFKNHTEPAYFGGPVDVSVPSVVFRSPTAPEHAVRLYGNTYLTFDADLISEIFKGSQSASRPRLFLGRAQWAPEQLKNEIRRGGWYQMHADGDLIFSAHPDSLWLKLHNQAAPSKYIRFRILPGGHSSTEISVAM